MLTWDVKVIGNLGAAAAMAMGAVDDLITAIIGLPPRENRRTRKRQKMRSRTVILSSLPHITVAERRAEERAAMGGRSNLRRLIRLNYERATKSEIDKPRAHLADMFQRESIDPWVREHFGSEVVAPRISFAEPR